jgi:hypothetical protein
VNGWLSGIVFLCEIYVQLLACLVSFSYLREFSAMIFVVHSVYCSFPPLSVHVELLDFRECVKE